MAEIEPVVEDVEMEPVAGMFEDGAAALADDGDLAILDIAEPGQQTAGSDLASRL